MFVYSCEVAKGVLARVGTSKEEGGSLLRRLQQAPREAMCATTSNLKLCSSVRHNIQAVLFLVRPVIAPVMHLSALTTICRHMQRYSTGNSSYSPREREYFFFPWCSSITSVGIAQGSACGRAKEFPLLDLCRECGAVYAGVVLQIAQSSWGACFFLGNRLSTFLSGRLNCRQHTRDTGGLSHQAMATASV